jgi:hypothetical protein
MASVELALIGALALMLPFLFVDFTFCPQTCSKSWRADGCRWRSARCVMAMYTWRRGGRLLFEKLAVLKRR